VRWSGVIAPGSICRVPVTSPDFFPTILEAAMLEPMPAQHADGVSLMPLLRGEAALKREAIFWHYPHYGNQGGTPGSSMRSGEWKLVEFFEDGRLELYNLEEDIREARNLAGRDPRRARSMRAQLARWRESMEALLPQPNPEFEPWRESDL